MVPNRGVRLVACVLLCLVGACTEEVDPELLPDLLLRDSLGLTDEDRVHRVTLDAVGNQERVRPAEVRVLPGSWVQFRTADRRVHTVAFELDSLAAPAADFLRGTGQDGSPPLLEQDARFLVSFEGAPPGRYPFLVEGNGVPTRGAVVVSDDGEG